MRRLLLALALAALPLAASACGDSPTAPSIEKTEFAASLGVDLSTMTRTSTGLYYADRQVGTGATAEGGKTVGVYYTGWFTDGRRFDGRTSGTPLTWTLGQPGMIAGFEQGVTGMKVGGKRLLVIPPSLGYGSEPYMGIPGNSILVFEVTLVSVQ